MRRRLSRRRFCVSVSWQLRAAASSEPWLRRLPVRNQADAVKTGVPHALDNLLDRVPQQVTQFPASSSVVHVLFGSAYVWALFIICRGEDAPSFVRTRCLRIPVPSQKGAAVAPEAFDGPAH
jgi:hypothetical protein